MQFSTLCNSCGPLRAAFFLSVLVAAPTSQAATSNNLKFEQVFSAAKEPAGLHYQASYEDAHGKHELEVWRDKQNRLRRRTDSRIDLYATAQRDGDLSISVLDHTRRMRTDVSRSSLYQLGKFSDWFGLAHGISKPLHTYSLQHLDSVASKEPPLVPCQWFKLDAEPQHSAICWSQAFRLPILITDANGEVRWRITSVDKTSPAASVFEIADKGYIHVNADEDIKAD